MQAQRKEILYLGDVIFIEDVPAIELINIILKSTTLLHGYFQKFPKTITFASYQKSWAVWEFQYQYSVCIAIVTIHDSIPIHQLQLPGSGGHNKIQKTMIS